MCGGVNLEFMLLYNTFTLLPPPTVTKLLPEEGPI